MDEMHFEKSYLENVECINGDCYSYSVENACPSLINHAKNRLQDKSVQCGLVKHNYHHYPTCNEDTFINDDVEFKNNDDSDDDETEYDSSHMDTLFDHFIDSINMEKEDKDNKNKSKKKIIIKANSTKKNKK